MPAQVDVPALVEGVLAERRSALAKAITLVESTRADHRAAARDLVSELTRVNTERGLDVPRVGISGVPGVGKSTFIESLGTHLTGQGLRVGVLAVDPSSVRTGGSVLGDKTRMGELATDPAAYIRPSPSAGHLGGVGDHPEMPGRRQAALVGIQHVQPSEHIAIEGVHPDPDLGVQPEIHPFPGVQRPLVER